MSLGIGGRVHGERIYIVHFAIDITDQREKCVDNRVEYPVSDPIGPGGFFDSDVGEDSI